jgi:hypothetical protein
MLAQQCICGWRSKWQLSLPLWCHMLERLKEGFYRISSSALFYVWPTKHISHIQVFYLRCVKSDTPAHKTETGTAYTWETPNRNSP